MNDASLPHFPRTDFFLANTEILNRIVDLVWEFVYKCKMQHTAFDF